MPCTNTSDLTGSCTPSHLDFRRWFGIKIMVANLNRLHDINEGVFFFDQSKPSSAGLDKCFDLSNQSSLWSDVPDAAIRQNGDWRDDQQPFHVQELISRDSKQGQRKECRSTQSATVSCLDRIASVFLLSR